MIAFDVVKDGGSAEPDAAATKRLTGAALERGLVLLSCGTEFNTIRILVPLTASDELVDEGMGIIGEAMSVARAA
jgi:4-aminobutyrate aminotransferase/(S)-3-amino-2-methylpropionate transaminase